MAINAVPVQAVINTSTTQSITIDSGDGWSAPTSGQLIVLMASFRVDSATANSPTFAAAGFSVVRSDYSGVSLPRGAIAWKVSDGSESSISIDAHSTDILNNWSLVAATFDPTDLDLSAVEVSNAGGTDSSVTSRATGSASSAASAALCITMLASATHNPWDNGAGQPAVDNSYTKRTPTSSVNSNVGLWWATKASAASGDQGATWTTTDTGGSAWAAVVVFAGSSSGPTIQQGINQFGYGAGSLDGVLQL